MPTPEEIKKIASEYETQLSSFFVTAEEVAVDFLEWLSKDFCIVPKSKLQCEYRKSYSAAFEQTTCLDRQYARGRYQVLREIFGKLLFEEEK